MLGANNSLFKFKRRGEIGTEVIGFFIVVLAVIVALSWYFQNSVTKESYDLNKVNVNLDVLQANINMGCDLDYFHNRVSLLKVPSGELMIDGPEVCITSLVPTMCRVVMCNLTINKTIDITEGIYLNLTNNGTIFNITKE